MLNMILCTPEVNGQHHEGSGRRSCWQENSSRHGRRQHPGEVQWLAAGAGTGRIGHMDLWAPSNVPSLKALPMNTILTRSISVLVIVVATGAAVGQPPEEKKAFEPLVRPFDVWSIAFSKDGKIVAASGGMWDHPGEIGVWEFATRKPLARFPEDLGVASVALSPDGKLLASGSWTGNVRVRDW